MKFGGLFSFFSTGTRHVAVTWELESIISEIYRGNVLMNLPANSL